MVITKQRWLWVQFLVEGNPGATAEEVVIFMKML
jgi:hypothetical protein